MCGQVLHFVREVRELGDLPVNELIDQLMADQHLIMAPHTLEHWPEELLLPATLIDRDNREAWTTASSCRPARSTSSPASTCPWRAWRTVEDQISVSVITVRIRSALPSCVLVRRRAMRGESIQRKSEAEGCLSRSESAALSSIRSRPVSTPQRSASR